MTIIDELGRKTEYIEMDTHKKVIEELLSIQDMQQIVNLTKERMEKPYSADNPYFKNMRNLKFKIGNELERLGYDRNGLS